MASEKWHTVGSKTRGGQKHHHQSNKPAGVGVVRELSVTVNRYGTSNDEDNPPRQTERHSEGIGEPANSTTTTSVRSSKRKTSSKKSKSLQQEKQSFDECVRELDSETIATFTEEACSKYMDSPQNLLKEVAGSLQMLFQQVEPEKDYAFSNRPPGYPLSSLSTSHQEPLLSAVASCPPLAQEAIFRYCLDRLLGEVRAGLPSHGTRIMLQLLIQCNPSTCSEATNRIKLLLQSSLSKVGEALSLLWVGLPHPRLQPTVALSAWPELCLPLLYAVANVPKQVMTNAIDYTCLLLSTIGTDGGSVYLKALPPNTAAVLFTSPLFVGKKTQLQGNIRELVRLLQETLLSCCTDQQVAKYFTLTFKRLDDQLSSQVLLLFAIRCLNESELCFGVWSHLSPSSPHSSVLLLRELYALDKLPGDISPSHFAELLHRLCERGTTEEKGLAQRVLSHHAAHFVRDSSSMSSSQKGSRGCCSVCCVLVTILSIFYLYLLWLFLKHLATEGPDVYLERIQAVFKDLNIELYQLVDVMWRCLVPFVSFFQDLLSRAADYAGI